MFKKHFKNAIYIIGFIIFVIVIIILQNNIYIIPARNNSIFKNISVLTSTQEGNLIDSLWELSDYYFQNGKYEESIKICKIINKLDPYWVEPYCVAAWLYNSLNREQEAINTYLEGINANPDKYQIYFEAGMFFSTKHKYSQALRYLEKASSLDAPSYVKRMLANIYIKSGNKDKAIETYQEILKEDPDDEIAKYRLNKLMQ